MLANKKVYKKIASCDNREILELDIFHKQCKLHLLFIRYFFLQQAFGMVSVCLQNDIEMISAFQPSKKIERNVNIIQKIS